MVKSSDIDKVIKIVETSRYRPVDGKNRPGGLLDFSKASQRVIVIGDLHGSIENLKAIIDHNDNRDALEKGNMFCVIIGDGMHNDQTGSMMEMGSSMEVLEEIYRLILEYPDRVFYIRGNHDTFDDRLVKSGIKQGREFQHYLIEHCGEEYTKKTDDFFDSLPLLIMGKDYVITHAGPIRKGATKDEIINIRDNEDHYHQLLWNRLHEFRGTPNQKEYDEKDIRNMLSKLDMPLDTPFIVGHNPMWNTGNRTGIWKDIIGIKNHYIIYSNIGTYGPYLLIEDGEVDSHFAVKKETERFL